MLSERPRVDSQAGMWGGGVAYTGIRRSFFSCLVFSFQAQVVIVASCGACSIVMTCAELGVCCVQLDQGWETL